MSRFHFSVIAILFFVLVGLGVIEKNYKNSMPKIQLPERAHNTIGEIPLVEHYDDGDLGGRSGYKGRNWGYVQIYGSIITGHTVTFVSGDSVSYGRNR